ncbi:MAG: hypothetical protein LQ346_006994 [Caloplaca aetnensis]|nr:MAG: hypothetical protein LQ346_006994 [Caloplaca aetnensis]
MLSAKTGTAVLFLFLSCLKPSHTIFNNQIDIRLSFTHKLPNARDPITATCIHTAQAECCRPHEEALLLNSVTDTILDYGSTNISFTGLLYGQSGAGWGAGGPLGSPTLIYRHIECAGIPVVTTGGPGHTGAEEALQTPPEGQAPRLHNMAFAAAWVVSSNGYVGHQRPRLWRYPDMYTVKGVDYWKSQGEVYRSAQGRVLILRTMTEIPLDDGD